MTTRQQETLYEICDWQADMLDLNLPNNDILQAKIRDLRDQINLLDGLMGYDPEEDERERDRQYEIFFARYGY